MYAVVSARLPKELEDTYVSILQGACDLWDKIPSRSELPKLRERIVRAICLVERKLSAWELDIKLHNMLHLVEGIENNGERAGDPPVLQVSRLIPAAVLPRS